MSMRIGPGEIVDGKFRVERVLGVGGMGFVVAARQIGLERRVALKFVRASRCDPDSIARFMREARATVRLRSEHVARILDVSTLVSSPSVFSPPDTPAQGTPYLVMEYLEGRDLGALLRERGPIPFGEATAYVLQACEAMAEAHAHGIVHRDLKPENLFLTSRVDGRPLVKVLDFGISKLTIQPESGPDAMSLTRTEDLVGSPNYMPPEQLRAARTVDARADLWSLGVILYELIAGCLPFQGRTIMQLCALVMESEPTPLAKLRPEVPAALSDAIMRCLRKDPGERWPNVIALAAAIEPFATGAEPGVAERLRHISTAPPLHGDSSPPARPPPHGATNVAWAETQRDGGPRRRPPLAWVAAALAAAAVTLGAIAALVFLWQSARGAARDEGPGVTADPVPALSAIPRAPADAAPPRD
jgi:serine/threonine protein kinase